MLKVECPTATIQTLDTKHVRVCAENAIAENVETAVENVHTKKH